MTGSEYSGYQPDSRLPVELNCAGDWLFSIWSIAFTSMRRYALAIPSYEVPTKWKDDVTGWRQLMSWFLDRLGSLNRFSEVFKPMTPGWSRAWRRRSIPRVLVSILKAVSWIFVAETSNLATPNVSGRRQYRQETEAWETHYKLNIAEIDMILKLFDVDFDFFPL